MSTPETSLIIRTFNEERHLPNLFDALDRQRYRDFEIIVVDSGSLDRTREIAESRADRLIRIASHDFTFGYSLNAGIKAANGQFIAIASAHTLPCDSDWLETLITPLRDPDTAMAYGRQFGVASSRFSEVEDFRRTFGPNPRKETVNDFRVNDANSAIRKQLWAELPFDEELPGHEDIAWARYWMGKGYNVIYQPDAALYHIHDESWRQIRHRFYREAVALRRMNIKGRRHVPWQMARESVYAVLDMGKALRRNSNPASERLSLLQRQREILLFRANKTAGMMMGMMKPHPLETQSEREDVMFNRTTQAVVIEGPGRAALETVDIPEIKPGEVLIRVAHVAVCATDLEILNGTLGYYANGMASYPIVPGHEFSGHIVALGPNVDGLGEGDAVVAECIQSCGICAECRTGNFIGCAERREVGVLGRNGAYAGYLVTPARFVHKLPGGMDLRAAALTEPLAVVLKGLRRLNPALGGDAGGRRWAVIGAGPLGHLCALVLAHRGYRVTAFDRNPKRRALFDGSGIATAENLDELSGFEIIIEITGDSEVLDTALHKSPANAALLLLGLPYGQRSFSFEAVAAYDKTVIGSVGSTAEDFEAAIALLPALDLNSYFDCMMPLEEFAAGWKMSASGEVLKVMLDPHRSAPETGNKDAPEIP